MIPGSRKNVETYNLKKLIIRVKLTYVHNVVFKVNEGIYNSSFNPSGILAVMLMSFHLFSGFCSNYVFLGGVSLYFCNLISAT